MRQTKLDKQIDQQIEAIYYRRCSGIQIDIMDIGKVFQAGRAAIVAGQDPEPVIVAFVETIRKDRPPAEEPRQVFEEEADADEPRDSLENVR